MRPPPDFASIAEADTKRAFVNGHPEVVAWLRPGTKLFKWTQSITTYRGVSPWWQFLESTRLTNGTVYPGVQDFQEYAARLGVHDGDYARVRAAVTEEWNKITNPVSTKFGFLA